MSANDDLAEMMRPYLSVWRIWRDDRFVLQMAELAYQMGRRAGVRETGQLVVAEMSTWRKPR